MGTWWGSVTGAHCWMVRCLCLAVSFRVREGATESASVMGKRVVCHALVDAVKEGRREEIRRCCSIAGAGCCRPKM